MRFKLFINTYLLWALLAFLSSASSYAATTQGPLSSTTSTGTIDVSVGVGNEIVVYGLSDVNFGSWSLGDGTISSNQDICIGKNDFFQPYAIVARGDGDGIDPSAFTLSNGVDQIYYNVNWNDQAGTGGQVLLPGSLALGQTGGFFDFLVNRRGAQLGVPCGGGGIPIFFFFTTNSRPNANLEITIPATELSSAIGGSYSGTLTLVVMPN